MGNHIFHITVGILHEVDALVEKNSMVQSRKFIKITFFVSCHAIKLKVNGPNRLKAKNHRKNLYQSGKVFISRPIILHWIGDRPNFGQKLMGCSLRGLKWIVSFLHASVIGKKVWRKNQNIYSSDGAPSKVG